MNVGSHASVEKEEDGEPLADVLHQDPAGRAPVREPRPLRASFGFRASGFGFRATGLGCRVKG